MVKEFYDEFIVLMKESNRNLSIITEAFRQHKVLLQLSESQDNDAVVAQPKMSSPDEELITVCEACAILHISRTTMGRLRREGLLTSVKQGRYIRLLYAEVIAAKSWYSIPRGKL